ADEQRHHSAPGEDLQGFAGRRRAEYARVEIAASRLSAQRHLRNPEDLSRVGEALLAEGQLQYVQGVIEALSTLLPRHADGVELRIGNAAAEPDSRIASLGDDVEVRD